MQPKNVAIKAAKEASQVILSHFKKFKPGQVGRKSQYELVTAADYQAERIILQIIKRHFPGHQILSEEVGLVGRRSDYLWLVDPLDGTTNFVMGSPLFAVALTLYYQEEPLVGVVMAPFLDELYVAEKGRGSYLNNKKIWVSGQRKIKDSLLTFCYGNTLEAHRRAVKIYTRLENKATSFRQLGSAALEHGFVAAGRTDAIMINDTNPWDVGAGALLVREAGGRVTDYQGANWNLKSRDILASNGKIHNNLLRYLKGIK